MFESVDMSLVPGLTALLRMSIPASYVSSRGFDLLALLKLRVHFAVDVIGPVSPFPASVKITFLVTRQTCSHV